LIRLIAINAFRIATSSLEMLIEGGGSYLGSCEMLLCFENPTPTALIIRQP
jgi:hypothetical protein